MQTAGPKSVRSGNEQPLIALRCLLLMVISTPLRIVNRRSSGFPVRGGIQMLGSLTFEPLAVR